MKKIIQYEKRKKRITMKSSFADQLRSEGTKHKQIQQKYNYYKSIILNFNQKLFILL